MNNFSLLATNRLTHLKVVMLAFACVTLVVGFGLVHSALPHEPFEPHHCRALASVVCATDCEVFRCPTARAVRESLVLIDLYGSAHFGPRVGHDTNQLSRLTLEHSIIR